MKKLFLTLSMAALTLCGFSAMAQNDDSKLQVTGTLFQHVGIGYDNDNDAWAKPGYELERAYFGARYTFDDNWQATIIFDAVEGAGNEHAFVKNAFVRYQKGNFSMKAGMIPTEQGLTSEKLWGYRYAYKSFYDAYGWGASADLGIELRYKFTDWFTAEAMMLNGEGFKNTQMDNHFLYTLGLTFKPIDGLTLRLYADIKTCDTDVYAFYFPVYKNYTKAQENLGLFAGYENEMFNVGFEFNTQFNNEYFAGHDRTGISLFGTYKMNDKINILARYDHGASKDNSDIANIVNWKHGKDCDVAMLGMQYKFNKFVSIAPIIRYNDQHEVYGYLSAKIAF